MSGGSYDYLYLWENPRADDFKRMAAALEARGYTAAAEQTEAFAREPSGELRALWQAVEYRESGDSGEALVEAAFAAWLVR